MSKEQERDKSGRYANKKGPPLDNIVAFRVTLNERKEINKAKKKGLNIRKVVVEQAKQKVIKNDTK